MLAADPDLQVRPSRTPSLRPHPDQFAYAFLIQDLEGVVLQIRCSI